MADFRAELQALIDAYDKHGGRWPQEDENALCDAVKRARDLLAQQEQEHPADGEALAARPLLEHVAQMGDRISQRTVGEIRAISGRAAHWLAENPPGQPVAIEPRGCPTPGACLCVQSTSPVPPADGEVAELVAWMRSRAGIPSCPDFPAVAAMLTRAADLLERQQPQPIPVSERLPEEGEFVAVGWCRADDIQKAMKRRCSFFGWITRGTGKHQCDMRLYAPRPRPAAAQREVTP